MLNGNWYGLIITLLTLVIAVILTVRHVSDTGIRFEVVIQPVPVIRPKDDEGRKIKDNQSEQGKKHTEQLAAG